MKLKLASTLAFTLLVSTSGALEVYAQETTTQESSTQETEAKPVTKKKITKAQIEEQISKLKSPDPEIQNLALDQLRQFGSPAAKLVVSFLNDPDPAFRLHIARLLGDYKSPVTIPKIANQLKKEEMLDIRRKLVQSLGKIGGSAIVEPLKDHLGREKMMAVQRDCLLALGESNDPEAVDIILEFAESKGDPYFEEIAGFALRRMTGRCLDLKLPVWREWWDLNREMVRTQHEKIKAEKETQSETSDTESN